MSSSPLPVFSVARIILIWLIAVLPAIISAQEKGWHPETIPNAWRAVPKGELAPIHGYSWYRALVVIPESWKGDELALYIEAMDDARATYVNGQLVGIAGAFPPKFRSGLGESGQYVVGEGLLRFGNVNTVAIRVYQNDPRPNFSVAPPVLLNRSDSEAIRLEGTWQYRPGDDLEWSKATLAQFTDSSLESISDSSSSNGIYRRVDKVDDVNRYVTKREGDTDP